MAELVIDPVCKMQIDPNTAAAKSDHNGTTYYFCAVGCKLAFDEEPAKYLSGAPSPSAASHAPTSEASAAGIPAGGESKPPWWQFWKT